MRVVSWNIHWGCGKDGRIRVHAIIDVLRKLNPSLTVVVALLADATAAVVAAVFYGLVPAVVLGLTAGVAAAMGKLSLDATIQRDVPERNRTSASASRLSTIQ